MNIKAMTDNQPVNSSKIHRDVLVIPRSPLFQVSITIIFKKITQMLKKTKWRTSLEHFKNTNTKINKMTGIIIMIKYLDPNQLMQMIMINDLSLVIMKILQLIRANCVIEVHKINFKINKEDKLMESLELSNFIPLIKNFYKCKLVSNNNSIQNRRNIHFIWASRLNLNLKVVLFIQMNTNKYSKFYLKKWIREIICHRFKKWSIMKVIIPLVCN
jgi:hypothetical protein